MIFSFMFTFFSVSLWHVLLMMHMTFWLSNLKKNLKRNSIYNELGIVNALYFVQYILR